MFQVVNYTYYRTFTVYIYRGSNELHSLQKVHDVPSNELRSLQFALHGYQYKLKMYLLSCQPGLKSNAVSFQLVSKLRNVEYVDVTRVS